MYHKQGYQTNKNDWLDTLATKIAEVRLSELGYRFIPGIAPYFTRAKKFIEARALIVKKGVSIGNDANPENDKRGGVSL
ncbi:MAG: hypothetical protein A2868_03965 [Candidatus Levybacteria bacterium RIFCSPHIGHO2_01_FULL_40_15b]|nr:MAG: hypothetical protein A2868_03965 [Candidatus Levybacteria bacterium RIFCSPHIGHO2_01_FULL_40_15b]